MKTLLFGKNGQVGWDLMTHLNTVSTVVATDRNQIGGDLSIPFDCAGLIKAERPDVVINAAAYTAVDLAERDINRCHRVNAEAVGEIAVACAEVGALLVHYSTDYVFDGSGSLPWNEEDSPNPINVYGSTKLKGERLIQEANCRHLIFRTSWIYGIHGNNFPKSILELAHERNSLSIISDQYGAPTSTNLISKVTVHAIKNFNSIRPISGIYHLVPRGETSWYEYAKYCIERALDKGFRLTLRAEDIVPISTGEYNSIASRPLNSRLSNRKIMETFNLSLPDWKIGVDRCLQKYLGRNLG